MVEIFLTRRILLYAFYWESLKGVRVKYLIYFLNIHGFLELPFSGLLYDEAIPLSKDFKTILGWSHIHFITAYYILRLRLNHKPTIELHSGFGGLPNIECPWGQGKGIKFPFLKHIIYCQWKICGWDDSHTILNELPVRTSARTRTFLTAFISCWLCLFIFLVKDVGYICPSTFMAASNMARR
ncbi:LOW QUALITY PROTEIN: hypothetical protein Cgig2_032094 [Carnegiea gigantea]|uniref:Uncharacterized protein n=1 Tax=Carnegiea gigantea TaxID=171969 RepID=A0A9Q1GP55_9CARY|nr:LOW QUALITY PROTEIN: hypothetical protein Cgig2_032094 [Carnegiea gigantea]